MFSRKLTLLEPRFCRRCGGSLKRSGSSEYRCVQCGTVRVQEQPRDFVLLRPSQVAETQHLELPDPGVIRRADRWARVQSGVASVGDVPIGLARLVADVVHSLAKGGQAAAGAASRRLLPSLGTLMRAARPRLQGPIRALPGTSLRVSRRALAIMAAQWNDLGYGLLAPAGVIILGVAAGVLAALLLS